jgi:hypothetical protein
MNKSDIAGIAERADSLPVTYAGPSSSNPQQQQQQDAADAALYRDMREALADFEAQQRKLSVAGKAHACFTSVVSTPWQMLDTVCGSAVQQTSSI